MIISNIIGGLGNQMFQYACGRALSLRLKQPLRITTDQFKNYKFHNGFELQNVFKLKVPQATISDLELILGWQRFPIIRKILSRSKMHWATCSGWCNEPHFEFWNGIKDIQLSAYLHGYWQSEKYFSDLSDQIRQDFTFNMDWNDFDLGVLKQMKTQPSASLHVRRGDYHTIAKNKRIFALCDINYYREAICLLRKRVPDIRIFAFSDDPDWVETYLINEFGPITIIRNNARERSANDMRLMSYADHHIIANSTFSWWGAWLNPSPEKIVIAPRLWFIDEKNDQDLIPSNWIRL